jgi:hypothetical protein
MARGVWIHVLLFAAWSLLAGCQSRPPVPQAQTVAIETREVYASADTTFTAAAGAMLDAGYTIRLSDRDAGLLTGFQLQENVGRMVGTATMVTARNILVLIAAGMSGASDAPLEGYPNTDSRLSLCVLIEETSPGRSQIRIRTYLDGAPLVMPEAVAVILNGVERQVMLVPPANTTTTSNAVDAAKPATPPPKPPVTSPAPAGPANAAPTPAKPAPKPSGTGITDPAPPRGGGKTR